MLRNFTGTVKDVHTDRRTLTVSVTMLGRTILGELPVGHVTEIDEVS